MATLQDLLNLLPDNTAGDIGADDMRTIVTELWNKITGVVNDQTLVNQALQAELGDHAARLDTLEDQASVELNYGTWNYNNGAQPPVYAQVRFDNADPAQATQVQFWKIDSDNADRSVLFQGNIWWFRIQMLDNSDAYHIFQVTAPATFDTDYVTLPIRLEESGAALTSKKLARCIFAVQVTL